jgi:hypothetical protein
MSLGRRLLALITAVLAVTGVMAVSTGVAFGRDTTPVGEMSSYDRATHTALPRASVAMPPLASAHGAVAAWTNAGRGMPPPTPPVLGAEEGPLTFTTTGGKTIEIPDDYVSGPSRTQGGTIYRPAGNSPTDLSNAIRVMPPTAQYADGYVIEYDANGNPVAPDGTVPRTRGDYHQPLAP